MRITRRGAVAGGLAAAALHWSGPASAQATRTRYSATTAQGKQNLAKYAKAVDLMSNQIPRGDPRHWEFQWYTHWIPGPMAPWPAVVARKQQVIDQVFAGKPPNDPNRMLATAMWNTCQAHGSNPTDPNFFQAQYFLPWHRHYVYFFEEIVRNILKDQTFTLPYWDYLSGNSGDLSIPPEFRDSGSPLFRANRNSWVNNGERIDLQNPGSMNLRCFNELTYINAAGVGFCPIIDMNPHGNIHVNVGQVSNMGSVPTAAGDPIFWLHHCNIDRLWESWNRLPNRRNPVWPDRSFAFASGEGKQVSVKAAAADRVSLLKYQYDRYHVPPSVQPIPVAGNVAATTMSLAAATPTTRAAAPAPVVLDSDVVRTPLVPAPSFIGPLATGTVNILSPSGPLRRLYLVLGGVEVHDASDSTYNVYLGLPVGAVPDGVKDPHYIGTMTLFGAAGHGGHGPGQAGHRQVFNITGKSVPPGAVPSITFVRRGSPDDKARPTIASMVLIEV